jgi:DNA-binding NarL/FixJ family response regulator
MEPRSSSPWRVLIVDDNVGFAELLSRAFHRDGRFEIVAVASNGAEGITSAAEHQPDVIVLDDEMPVRTGLESLEELVAVAPGAKIILFTANLQSAVAASALDRGAVASVSKLEPLRSLFEVIEHALGII